MDRRWLTVLLAIPCFLPAGWRLASCALNEPLGLCSDLALGLIIFALARQAPRWLRGLLLVAWALFQVISRELLAAVGRLPSWQDLHYLLDPVFLENSGAGLHLAEPVLVMAFLVAAGVALLLPLPRSGWKGAAATLLVGVLLLVFQVRFSSFQARQSVAALYNPLHWFVADVLHGQRPPSAPGLHFTDLPPGLGSLDLEGKSLLAGPRARNVLIITLEGISGIYHPEIRSQLGVEASVFQMEQLAEATREAMLIPDFVSHSHQTIRGLYAIHCGDISKLSFETPKALELQLNPARAGACLPAQLAQNGWDTHYLQGAPLQFMNKDKVMPAMGFSEVHGLEWFSERPGRDFIWGTSDDDFFRGARRYIGMLQQGQKPWLLSLLTVATHQPFDATEALVERYGSRKIAAVALLDQAVSRFINELREDGVLEETLVIITSDESHGAEGADRFSSWGYAAVLAPGQGSLPRLQQGTFGLMDTEASILDYMGLPMPSSIIGRSFFREYGPSREMVAYTAGKLRWQTADNQLYECSLNGNCQLSQAATILRPGREGASQDSTDQASRLFALAAILDHKLTSGTGNRVLQFAHGEVRPLPEKIRNEWSDNLVGAQYLDFPKDSRVEVDIRLKALSAGDGGVRLQLVLRQFEKEVTTIAYPPFPLLQDGEAYQLRFAFVNPEARKAFSFHLVGEGQQSSVQLEKFEVAINRGG
ncbi:LTA synthase family protein [Desulfogranum mediterraneum]|uniref:LTA synthase family protein n=1 Tax=Desulfogranum mediterraneum TaxID=160661 RepID=UPI00041D738F|nr:LTA synthase family protein [Desulfogranum mediterraneum]